MSNYKYKTKPYEHQDRCFYKLYDKEHFAILGEQGTGKTKMCIDIACNLYMEQKINAVLLIAPNQVHNQWCYEQIPKHCSVDYNAKVWNKRNSRIHKQAVEEFIDEPDRLNRLKWFCVNIETLSMDIQTRNGIAKIEKLLQYLKNHNCLTVVDESTRIKNPKANRTYNICYMLGYFKKYKKAITMVKPLSKYRAILTGTIVTNSPYDLWSMFEFLKFRFFKSNFFEFKARYGIEVRDTDERTDRPFSRKIRQYEIEQIVNMHKKGKTIEMIAWIMGTTSKSVEYIINHPLLKVPYKNLPELKRLIEPVSFIVRKKDCLDLPPKIYNQLLVEPSAEQKRIYNDLKKRMLAEYEADKLTVASKVALLGRLQQVTGGFFPYKEYEKGKFRIKPITPNPKLNRLKEDIEETADEVCIIWCRFVGEIKLLGEQLRKSFPEKVIKLYYGAIGEYERKATIEQFKQNKVHILIANPRTAGIGLNLQNCTFQYFYSNSYSLEDRIQAEDRCHRIGVQKAVFYKDIIMKGTVDEKIFSVLALKKDLLDYFRNNSFEEFIA